MNIIDLWYGDASYVTSEQMALCTIGGRTFTKTNVGKAVFGAYKRTSGYQGPLLVSTTSSYTTFSTSGHTFNPNYTITYQGLTWYVSASDYFMPNSVEYSGAAIRLNGEYATDQEAGLALLEAANVTVQELPAEWDDDKWSRYANKNDGYPYSKTTALPIVANVSGLFSPWTIDSTKNGGCPYIANTSLTRQLGAFRHATQLTQITIPESVKSIGAWSFTNSGLKSVTIDYDCNFFSTTFPSDCVIDYYTHNGNFQDEDRKFFVTADNKMFVVLDDD